jgi:hypothetical protein
MFCHDRRCRAASGIHFRYSREPGPGRYVESGRANLPREEALRDLLRERGSEFDTTAVTGAPGLKLIFPTM